MRKDAKINEIVTLDDFSKTPPAGGLGAGRAKVAKKDDKKQA